MLPGGIHARVGRDGGWGWGRRSGLPHIFIRCLRLQSVPLLFQVCSIISILFEGCLRYSRQLSIAFASPFWNPSHGHSCTIPLHCNIIHLHFQSIFLFILLRSVFSRKNWTQNRDVIKQYTASELLGSLYLNDTHKIWTLCPPYIAQRHAYFSSSFRNVAFP